MLFDTGDTITIENFSFSNLAGGTGMSKQLNLKAPIEVVVIREWNDYECGQRGWAIVKDIMYSKPPEASSLFEVFAANCQRAQVVIKKILEGSKNSTHLDEDEFERVVAGHQEMYDWIANTTAMKDGFIIYISEFNVLTRE